MLYRAAVIRHSNCADRYPDKLVLNMTLGK